jgi:hypothetical protein
MYVGDNFPIKFVPGAKLLLCITIGKGSERSNREGLKKITKTTYMHMLFLLFQVLL